MWFHPDPSQQQVRVLDSNKPPWAAIRPLDGGDFTPFCICITDEWSDPASHVLRELVEATHLVCWEAHVDLLRVGQVQVPHRGDKLLPGLRQARVQLLLLPHGGCCLALVIMCRVESGVIWEGEYPGPDRGVQSVCTPPLTSKVSPVKAQPASLLIYVTQPSVCLGVSATSRE